MFTTATAYALFSHHQREEKPQKEKFWVCWLWEQIESFLSVCGFFVNTLMQQRENIAHALTTFLFRSIFRIVLDHFSRRSEVFKNVTVALTLAQ